MGSAPLSGDRVCFIDKASCFLLKLWVHWKDKMHGNPRKVRLTSSAKTLELWGAVTPMWPEQKQRHRSQCPLWSPCDCGSWEASLQFATESGQSWFLPSTRTFMPCTSLLFTLLSPLFSLSPSASKKPTSLGMS